MKTWFSLVSLLALAFSACKADTYAEAVAGTSNGGGQTTGGTTQGTSGGTVQSGDSGLADCFVDTACEPESVVDSCVQCGLVCDQVSAVCRLPQRGEPCATDAGCGGAADGLGCFSSSVDSVPETVCEVPCTNADSSNCPYATGCGDPNLPNFCSPNGAAGCIAWSSCSLGGGVSGTCVPTGTQTICLAAGTETRAYAACDPAAQNKDSQDLCAAGSACLTLPPVLGGPPSPGFCFPMCSLPNTPCLSAETHCEQPSPSAYGICRPGSTCVLGTHDTCPAETVCVPDSPATLYGGCLPTDTSSAALGASCMPPTEVAQTSPCAFGTCLPLDGGYACTALCNLADGGEPYCLDQICTPLAPTAANAQIGACR